ncbi:MAG: hypothetical protein P8016_16040 [Sedimentisphaerales bacterium]|jgi:hypothetical protein
MAKLKSRDIQKVIQLFDNELLLIPRVSRLEKMKMRKKIVNVVQPALKSPTLQPEVFVLEVESKLADIISKFLDRYGFNRRLTEVMLKLYQRAEESSAATSVSDDQ